MKPTNKLETEIARYSDLNGEKATLFKQYSCKCGSDLFKLFSDDESGGANITCIKCNIETSIFNSSEYMEEVYQNTCTCENEELKITAGMAFHENSKNIKWVYVGAACPNCDLNGVYVDWQER